MEVIELMKYLGIGYRELMDSPGWVRKVAQIRFREEGEYLKYKKDHPGQ